MTKFGNLLAGAALGAMSLTLIATGASAGTTLVAGTGWQDDLATGPNVKTVNSPISFTVAAGGSDTFSLTDYVSSLDPTDPSYVDTYSISFSQNFGPPVGTIQLFSGSSTRTLYPTSFNNNLGDPTGAYDWTLSGVSHYQVILTPGKWIVTIKDTANPGLYDASLFYRLDAVPEPASWALMLVGVGGLGLALRSRRKVANATA